MASKFSIPIILFEGEKSERRSRKKENTQNLHGLCRAYANYFDAHPKNFEALEAASCRSNQFFTKQFFTL